MKRIISLALCLALCAQSALALDAVRPEKTFEDTADHWAAAYIDVCARTGLMEGVSDARFDPNGSLTLAQCAAVAVRFDAALTGAAEPARGSPWYQGYADALAARGVELPADLNAKCTREQFFRMLSAVTPETELEPINDISSLPDARDEAILRFYRAGILTGMDQYGSFRGHLPLTRAECAAMLARLADESLRTRFRPERGDGSDAMACLQLPAGETALTVGGRAVTAGLFTAALRHELEVAEAEAAVRARPEWAPYLTLWKTMSYAAGFERYLSEFQGINDWTATDWRAIDPDSGLTIAELALRRTMTWLREHAAVAELAQQYSLRLPDNAQDRVDRYIRNNHIQGESRVLYVTALLTDALLADALARRRAPSEAEVAELVGSGDYLCAEFVRFEKHDVNGLPLSEAELDLTRAGAEVFAQELKAMPSHFFIDYLTGNFKSAFTAPRATLWSKSGTESELWRMLSALAPLGVSDVLEDETGIYIYLVANPMADDVLMDDVRENYGADRASADIAKAAGAYVWRSANVEQFSAADYAARALV